MSDDKKNTGSPDRDRINVNEDYELMQYWTATLGVSAAELRAAVAAVGPPPLRSASIWENSAELPMSSTAASVVLTRPRSPSRARRYRKANAPSSWCSCTMPAAGTTTSACRSATR